LTFVPDFQIGQGGEGTVIEKRVKRRKGEKEERRKGGKVSN
jgi:hypothetical protein